MEITELTRRTIIDGLLLRPTPFYGNMDSISFLQRIWDLTLMPSTDSRFSDAEGDIYQHTINNYDWDDNFLLYTYLGIGKCPDEIFLKFMESAVHPLVGDAGEIANRLKVFNKALYQDGYRLLQTDAMSGRPLYSAKRIDNNGETYYEIVLSFAGEDREYVQKVADHLALNDVEVFYDRYEEVTLWGRDLVEYLDFVYRSNAKYCVMFISKHYAEKLWPNHERKSALARAFVDRQEYILPARFDNTQLPGILPTVGHIDLTKKTPVELGELILRKLGRRGV